ncbi:YcbK family protein [Pleomorphomonas oryzae]|uniref:YcbK family protein n=1 Tax=Pleomorphomonas oryzae TaxID=261934 RepID=UPI000413AD48|nr:D-Ala-D-Ala carboxypeptidase family metallohydrolase [Pleomorphomonas oryzae]
MTLRPGLLVLISLAAAGCGAVFDRSEFKPLTPTEIAEIKAKSDAEKSATESSDKPAAPSPAPQEGAAKPPAEETPAPPVAAAVAPEEKPKATSLFASLFGSHPSDSAPAPATPAQPDPAKTPEKASGDTSASTNTEVAKVDPAANAKPGAAAQEQPDDTGEVSEAELAGEAEADPSKVAVPKPPVDDGLEHDFVNVYTARPDRPQELFEGLPGVAWQGNLVLASRGPDGDPRGLFDGEVQPYAHYVPGLPREVVQAANGLLLANSSINVSCVKPRLLGMVRDAERHFSRKVVITSGYRSPAHNRLVQGALHSQHLYCNAVDLYMPGIARDELARYFYDHPSRGGLGLYCHTKSIHVDTGRRREWRWSCRGRG